MSESRGGCRFARHRRAGCLLALKLAARTRTVARLVALPLAHRLLAHNLALACGSWTVQWLADRLALRARVCFALLARTLHATLWRTALHQLVFADGLANGRLALRFALCLANGVVALPAALGVASECACQCCKDKHRDHCVQHSM